MMRRIFTGIITVIILGCLWIIANDWWKSYDINRVPLLHDGYGTLFSTFIILPITVILVCILVNMRIKKKLYKILMSSLVIVGGILCGSWYLQGSLDNNIQELLLKKGIYTQDVCNKNAYDNILRKRTIEQINNTFIKICPEFIAHALYQYGVKGDNINLSYYLSQGVDINILSYGGNKTALIGAVESRYIETIKYLLQRGADPKLKNIFDQNAIDIAKKEMDYYKRNNISDIVKEYEIIITLLEKGIITSGDFSQDIGKDTIIEKLKHVPVSEKRGAAQ